MKELKLVICLLLLSGAIYGQDMDNAKMKALFEIECDSLSGVDGAWQFDFNGRAMFCFTDENNNRMRIIAPISMVEKLDELTIYEAMIANFHSALDVKYAISEDIMWSIFVHPLKELSEHQLKDALRQVYSAAETFGTTYNSTDLIFPGGSENKTKELNQSPSKKM